MWLTRQCAVANIEIFCRNLIAEFFHLMRFNQCAYGKVEKDFAITTNIWYCRYLYHQLDVFYLHVR